MLVGWLVERLTPVAVVHRHNLHQQISGSAPETSLLPSLPASGGLLEQKQEQEWKDSKSPTVTEHQPLAKHKPSKATPETPTDWNPHGGRIKATRGSTIGTMHRSHGQHHATRQGEIRSLLSGQLLQNDRPLSEVVLTNGSTPTAQSNGSRPATRGDYTVAL